VNVRSYALLIAYLEELFDDKVDESGSDSLHVLWKAGDKRVSAYTFSVVNTSTREEALLVGLGHAFKECWNPDESVYTLVELSLD